MKIKSIVILLACLLFLSAFAMVAVACLPPDCGDCKEWDPVKKECVLKEGAGCGVDSDCDPDERCENCQCCTDIGGSCRWDQECCSGHCNLITDKCVECALDTECEECEVCLFDIGFCVSILPCPLYTHCDNHACVPDCVENGPMCTYTSPGLYPGCDHPIDSYQCIDPGGACYWEVTQGPHRQANCVVPDCTTFPAYCVELTPWLCYNKFVIFLGITCACDETHKGAPVTTGSRERCP